MARSDATLRLIGAFKLVKVASLATFGVLALTHLHTSWADLVERSAHALGVDPGSRYVDRLVGRVVDLGTTKREELGIGALCYAALFFVEGAGLLARKVWAEYFTVIITTSFIPLEIFELVHKRSAWKLVVIALNIAIVVYLVVRIHHDSAVKRRGGSPRRAPSRSRPAAAASGAGAR